MPRKAKGPRLYYRKAGEEWVIRDGASYQRTGCGKGETEEAERKLADYIAAKWQPKDTETSPNNINCTDVIMIYLEYRLPDTPRPRELTYICDRLVDFWGKKNLDDIKGKNCREYAKRSSTQSMARHDLEIFRAAVKHYGREHGLEYEPSFTLPKKGPPRHGWLTREMAAKFIWEAYRSGNKHLVRFLLISLYTGTRAGAVYNLQWFPNTTGGYVDLERNVIYRAPKRHVETNKRKPPITIPDRLRPHLRRWRQMDTKEDARIRYIVHWNGNKVSSVKRSFNKASDDANLPDWVIPHCLRHTSITWAMHAGVDPMEACGYFGVTMKVMQSTYLHHHPDFQEGIRKAF